MSDARIHRNVLTDASWWHWTLTIPLLALHLAGYPWAFEGAAGLCVAAGVYFLIRLRQFRPMPVQIRIAYLALLVVGLVPGMRWVHWVQLVGTSAMVTVGYCLLARSLSLLPLNRSEPLTPSLVWRAFLREPCAGGIIRWSRAAPTSALGCCSLPAPDAKLVCSLPPVTVQRRRDCAETH